MHFSSEFSSARFGAHSVAPVLLRFAFEGNNILFTFRDLPKPNETVNRRGRRLADANQTMTQEFIGIFLLRAGADALAMCMEIARSMKIHGEAINIVSSLKCQSGCRPFGLCARRTGHGLDRREEKNENRGAQLGLARLK